MDGHDALDTLVERMGGKGGMQQYRDQTRLPVVAMDDLRMETDDRHHCKHCLAEEGETLDIPVQIAGVGRFAVEIVFVIDKVELDAVEFIFHDADVFLLTGIVHIEVMTIVEEVAVSSRNAGVIGDDDTDVKAFLIQVLGQGADNIGKTAGFYEWYTFGRCK